MSMGDKYSDEKLQLFIDNEMNSRTLSAGYAP